MERSERGYSAHSGQSADNSILESRVIHSSDGLWLKLLKNLPFQCPLLSFDRSLLVRSKGQDSDSRGGPLRNREEYRRRRLKSLMKPGLYRSRGTEDLLCEISQK